MPLISNKKTLVYIHPPYMPPREIRRNSKRLFPHFRSIFTQQRKKWISRAQIWHTGPPALNVLNSRTPTDIEMADVSVPSLHLDAFRLVEKTCKDFVDLTEGELLPDDVQRHLEKAVDGLKALSNSKAPIVGVLGNTGAGKSTLICSILKWMGLPRSSQVRIPTCLLAVLNPVSVLTSIRGAQSI